MKTVHLPTPRPDYESAAYLVICFAATAVWVIFLARAAIRFLESLPL